MDEAEYCNHVSNMVDGKQLHFGPQELKEQFQNRDMAEVFLTIAESTKKKR